MHVRLCVCVCVFDKEMPKRLQCGRINRSLVLVLRIFPNTLLRQGREANSEEHRTDLSFLNSQPLTPNSYSVKWFSKTINEQICITSQALPPYLLGDYITGFLWSFETFLHVPWNFIHWHKNMCGEDLEWQFCFVLSFVLFEWLCKDKNSDKQSE